MEMMVTGKQLKKYARFSLCTVLLVAVILVKLAAQPPAKIYTIRNGRMYIELSKHLNEAALDSFIVQFDLTQLSLKQFIRSGAVDSLKNHGWSVDKNNHDIFAISKPLNSSGADNNPADQILMAEKSLSVAQRFSPVNSSIIFGYNRFKRNIFSETPDSVTRFFLRNNLQSKRVMLAGSFNNFSPKALAMRKTDSGWIANVKLAPGKYWYKFIVDNEWRTDVDNMLRENDGEGNTNSVFYKTNIIFHLNSFTAAKKIYLAGSFNNWNEQELSMHKIVTGWELPLYLAEGTYTYRFIVDKKWYEDPANNDRVPNEFDEFNSVIRIGKPYLFRLRGFENAHRIFLTGTFNGWRKNELIMKKTVNGWELPYTLGAGNYQYRFVVDGNEITDPANPVVTGNDRTKGNSFLILGENYIFRLKGSKNARVVYLAGDFNDFSPDAFAMNKKGDDWIFSLHLSPGKHIYKFVVDGNWILDPANKLWEQNEYGTGNSVIWIEP